jgi:hypothetical protein
LRRGGRRAADGEGEREESRGFKGAVVVVVV